MKKIAKYGMELKEKHLPFGYYCFEIQSDWVVFSSTKSLGKVKEGKILKTTGRLLNERCNRTNTYK